MSLSAEFMDGLKKYLIKLPGVELIYSETAEKVMKLLEEDGVHPAVWVAVGNFIADEGAYRALDRFYLTEEDLSAYVNRDKLQSTANLASLSEKI